MELGLDRYSREKHRRSPDARELLTNPVSDLFDVLTLHAWERTYEDSEGHGGRIGIRGSGSSLEILQQHMACIQFLFPQRTDQELSRNRIGARTQPDTQQNRSGWHRNRPLPSSSQ